MKGEKIIANNPSSNRLDFTYVKDAAKGIKLATFYNDKNKINEFNITRGESRSLEEVIKIIKDIFPKVKIEINSKKNGIYPKRGTLDIGKAREFLKFEPLYNLERGIEEYIKFIQD